MRSIKSRTQAHFVGGVSTLAVLLLSSCRSATDSGRDTLPIVFFDGGLTGQLVLMSEDGSLRRQLLDLPTAFALYPRWSPDGGKIAFRRQSQDPQGPGDQMVINADGSGLRQVSPLAGGMAGSDWSPDGTRLVIYSGSGLAVMQQDGTGLTPLPATNVDSRDGWGLSWSPDGNQILYNGNHAVPGGLAAPDVWVFNMVTGVSRMLATPGLDARWSPDGSSIAYVQTQGLGIQGSLVVMNSDGSNSRTLVQAGTAGQGWPELSWSPDGQRIMYQGERAPCGCTAIYSISVNGGASTTITNQPGSFAHYPDWQRTR